MGRLSKVLVFVVVLMVAAAGVALAANRIGNSNPNTLTGTDGNDYIYGLGAADTLNGLGGNDEISGNGGADTMNGGDGDDTMVGGPGVDRINTGNSINGGQVGGTDFAHAIDGLAETVCVGTGDAAWLVDGIDTVKGDPSPPTDCASADTVQLFPDPTNAAISEAGSGDVVSGSVGE